MTGSGQLEVPGEGVPESKEGCGEGREWLWEEEEE